MINKSIIQLLIARNTMPDLAMETYLATKPGILGVIGMQRIGEDYEQKVRDKKSAENRVTTLKKSDDGIRLLAAARGNKNTTDDVSDKDVNDLLEEVKNIKLDDPKTNEFIMPKDGFTVGKDNKLPLNRRDLEDVMKALGKKYSDENSGNKVPDVNKLKEYVGKLKTS